jgi:prefoldin subunit 5
MDHVGVYLLIHAITTIGTGITVLLRIEHRLTRLETKMENLEKSNLKCQTN